LIDVADIHATVFKKILQETVTLMCNTGGNTATYNNVRKLCVEFVTTLAEKCPGLCRRLPGGFFLNTVLPVVLNMLLEYGLEEPSDAEWNTDDENDMWEDGRGL
jgi:hypothetical protein